MKSFLLSLLVLSGASFSEAHDFDPSLAPVALEHRAKILQLAEKRDEATKIPRDAYLAALENGEQEAAAKGDAGLVERIGKEIRAVKVDTFETTEGFPRKLITARKALEKAVQQAQAEAIREAKKLNAGYLADLNRIPSGEGSSEKLLTQIASEKKAVAFGIIGPVVNLQTEALDSKWWSIENPGNINDYGKNGKLANTWDFTTPQPDELIIHWNPNSRAHLKLAKNGRVLLLDGKPFHVLVTEPKE